MSTPERPLTRRQLKEMRRTGQLPVITPEEAAEAADAQASQEAVPPAPEQAQEAPGTEPVIQASEPDDEPAPEPERPLTRKELRAQRLRTNQITAISDEDADGLDDAEAGADMAPQRAARLAVGFDDTGIAEDDAATEERPAEEPSPEAPVPSAAEAPEAEDEIAPSPEEVQGESEAAPAEPAENESTEDGLPKVGASFGAAVFRQADERQRAERERAEREAAERREAKAQKAEADDAPAAAESAEAPEAAPKTDTGELAADAFQRAAHSGGSTSSSTSSLILKDMPGTAALSAPITATGELILTSSHTLPAGLGTHGAAHGTTDGKDLDESLIDGEIPQHSSPTPIAASSAVSTSKAPGEVIRPPAPEKNRGLMLGLGITAGVLGIALIGVVVYVFATGALN